ncbi:MAG: ABC-type glutathione transport system ATPase component [Myxococcota bacterium]|jgi:ABC-type glutathione transport system ATPase component
MSGPIVDVRALHKTFRLNGPWPWSEGRDVRAVRGVDFSVQPGEVVALVGQSGSGKTTVSRIILGLEQPSSGEVWLEGARWDTLSEGERRARRVRYQYVPQDAMSALDPQQTALEHVTETLRVLGGLDRRSAVDKGMDMLERLGIEHRRDALPREMSGGEQRRVTLARVLALEPALVVADEPTSGLDPDRRESVLEALVGNLPSGSACVLVTHDMSEARQWCDRVLAMLAGRVIEEVALSRAAPAHPYARILFDPWAGPLPRQALASEGCPFQPDCPLVTEAAAGKCGAEVPELVSLEMPGHRVACHVLADAEPTAGGPP